MASPLAPIGKTARFYKLEDFLPADRLDEATSKDKLPLKYVSTSTAYVRNAEKKLMQALGENLPNKKIMVAEYLEHINEINNIANQLVYRFNLRTSLDLTMRVDLIIPPPEVKETIQNLK